MSRTKFGELIRKAVGPGNRVPAGGQLDQSYSDDSVDGIDGHDFTQDGYEVVDRRVVELPSRYWKIAIESNRMVLQPVGGAGSSGGLYDVYMGPDGLRIGEGLGQYSIQLGDGGLRAEYVGPREGPSGLRVGGS